MDLDIQWFWLGDVKACLSAVVRGSLVVGDFEEVLRRVGEASVSIAVPVLFDLRQASWNLDGADYPLIVRCFAKAGLGVEHKIALVCGRDIDHFGQLVSIASSLSNRGLQARAFYDFEAAVKWLANQWD